MATYASRMIAVSPSPAVDAPSVKEYRDQYCDRTVRDAIPGAGVFSALDMLATHNPVKKKGVTQPGSRKTLRKQKAKL